jgi:hypothetical protein
MTQPDPTAPPAAPATPPAPAPTPPTPPAPAPGPGPAVGGAPAADDKPLGPAGERALRAEREARQELERRLAGLAPLQALADALKSGTPAADGKTDVELLNDRFAQHERDLAAERTARLRLEVAADKGLNKQQAAWLKGATAEELAASADELLASFPAAPAGPRNPAPDPTQGQTGAPVDLDAQIADAQKNGDWKKVVSLQNQKLAAAAAKQ